MLFCSNYILGQNVFTGQIIDSITRNPIADATIIEFGTVNGISSDSLGYFKVYYSRQKPSYMVSHVAYKNFDFWLNGTGKNYGMIELTKENYLIGELDLSPRKLKKKAKKLKRLQCNDMPSNIELDSNFTIVESLFDYPGGYDCLDLLFVNYFLPKIENSYIKPFGVIDIEFTVDEHGLVSDVFINKEISRHVLEIINNVFDNMLKWEPAQQRDKNILTHATYRLIYN